MIDVLLILFAFVFLLALCGLIGLATERLTRAPEPERSLIPSQADTSSVTRSRTSCTKSRSSMRFTRSALPTITTRHKTMSSSLSAIASVVDSRCQLKTGFISCVLGMSHEAKQFTIAASA